MIAASGILVIVAFVTLIVGVFRTGLGLIWTSIAASVLAAIFLALGVVQGNKRRVATAGGPAAPMPAWSDQPATGTATAVLERERAPMREEVEDEEEKEEPPTLVAVPEPEAEPEPSTFAPTPAKKPAAARATTRSTAKKTAAKKPAAAASTGTVVVIPDRDKFHRDTCRYAKNPAAMSLTKAAAKRQGYKPCATCKP